MPTILPDILETKREVFENKLSQALAFSPRIHIDLIDTNYTDSPSLPPHDWPQLPHDSQISAHIMVKNPMMVIDACIQKGAKQLLVQLEDCHQQALVTYLQKKKISTGLAIDLPTSVNQIDTRVLPLINSILLMSVKAGKSGQQFDPLVLSKIRLLRQICGESTEIMVDGGINLETGKLCLNAGADTLVVNTFFWQAPEMNWQKLQQLR